MFDHVKVNQNSIINLLKIPEKVNPDIFPKRPSNDFYSMVMEKSSYETKPVQTADQQKINDKAEPVKNERNTSSEEKTGTNSRSDLKETERNEVKDGIKQETKSRESGKNSDSALKEIKDKQNSNKDSDDEAVLVNHLHGESNIKNLMEIIKAALNGNKKAEDESFQKLFNNLKSRRDKEYSNISLRKNDADKSQRTTPEIISSIFKDLKQSVNRELQKNIENRKPGNKQHNLSDKELKELAVNIIDNIKKNKTKEITRHEARIASADEARVEKKPLIQSGDDSVKKAVITDDSAFDKNGSKDKSSGKDSFNYNGGKIDFSAKSGIDKIEHNLKAADFKESLQEIIDKAKVTVRDSRNGSFTVRLNPQELGNVNVNLIMENGVITGKFLVENEEVKSLLMNSLNDLKYQLEDAGIAVGEFSVNVNDHGEKYLKQKDDSTMSSVVINPEREVITAAEIYDYGTAAYTGHINMVI